MGDDLARVAYEGGKALITGDQIALIVVGICIIIIIVNALNGEYNNP